MNFGIIIPTYNRRETILVALRSLFDALPSEHHVVVVDSGSSDGTSEAIAQQFPNVVLLQGDPSMWWAAATNLGIAKVKELGCSHALTFNDDNVVTPGLFATLAAAARLRRDCILSAVCCDLHRPDVVFFAGRQRAKRSDRFFYLDYGVPLSNLSNGIREVDLLHGMCTLFPMSVFNDVGFFDAAAFPSYFADDDLALRAVKAGYRLKVVLGAIVLNDRKKTGLNLYDRRLGPIGIGKLLLSRKSTFQMTVRTRFLWRHRRSLYYFFKTWIYDYARLFSLLAAKWVLPQSAFEWAGKKWNQRLHQT